MLALVLVLGRVLDAAGQRSVVPLQLLQLAAAVQAAVAAAAMQLQHYHLLRVQGQALPSHLLHLQLLVLPAGPALPAAPRLRLPLLEGLRLRRLRTGAAA